MNRLVTNAHVAMTIEPHQVNDFITRFYALTKKRFTKNFFLWSTGRKPESILYANLAVAHFCIVLETLNVNGVYNLQFNKLENTNNTTRVSKFPFNMSGASHYVYRQKYLSNRSHQGQLISFVPSRYKMTYEQLVNYLDTKYLPMIRRKILGELHGLTDNEKKIRIMEIILDHFRDNNVVGEKIINNSQIYHGMYSLLCMYGLKPERNGTVQKMKHPGHCGVAALLSTYLLSFYGLYDNSILVSPTAGNFTKRGPKYTYFGNLANPDVILSDVTEKCVLSHYEIWVNLGNSFISSNNPAKKKIPGTIITENSLSFPQFRKFYGDKNNAFIIFTLQQVFRARARNARRLPSHKLSNVQQLLDNLVDDFTQGRANLANSAQTVKNHKFNVQKNSLGRILFDPISKPEPGVAWKVNLLQGSNLTMVYELSNGKAFYRNKLSNGRFGPQTPVSNSFRNELRAKLRTYVK